MVNIYLWFIMVKKMANNDEYNGEFLGDLVGKSQ